MKDDARTAAWPAVAVFDNYWATTLTFAISLGRQGVPLHFYGRGAGRWSRYCSRRCRCPPVSDAARFLPWLRTQLRSGAITRVAPTTDLIAYYASCLREEFPLDVQRTILPLTEIENCLIKTRFSAACASRGCSTPATAAPDDPEAAVEAASALGYPLILKPKSHLVVGPDERGHLVQNAAELRAHYRRYPVATGQEPLAERYPELRWPLLQRYIPSARRRVYSVSGVKDPDTGILAASLSFKREQWPPDVGISTFQISCADESILQTGLVMADDLVSRGIFELELLDDRGSLLPIDLNPRAFGFMALDVALGRDLPWLWLRSTAGAVQPPPQVQLPAVALEARHKLLHFVRAVVGGPVRRRRRAERRAAPRRAAISMLGDPSDPLPMLVSNMSLFRHPNSLLRTQYRAARAARRRSDNLLGVTD